MTTDRWTWRRLITETAGSLLLAAVLTSILAVLVPLRTLTAVAAVFGFNLLVSVSIGALIDGTYRLLATKLALADRSLPVRLAVHAIVIAAATVAGVEIAFALGHAIVPEVAAAFPRAAVLQVAVPVTVVMVLIARERDRMRGRAIEAELGAERLEHQALQAELAALQSRTHPHFLFNALNTIAALIAEDPMRAEHAIERLAGLLRHALEGAKRPWVPVRDEIAAVESYLELERLRYGQRLRASIEVAPDIDGREIPPMLIQPLVENAVVHGVAARRGPTDVSLVVRGRDDELEIIVDNDGPGPHNSSHCGSGIGETDLRTRLRLLYGGRARVETGAQPGGGYRTVLVLPEVE